MKNSWFILQHLCTAQFALLHDTMIVCVYLIMDGGFASSVGGESI